MPVHSHEQFCEQRFDAIFNQDSFPEMPVEIVRDYLRLAAERLQPGGLLFSINQEAFSPMEGKAPPWVPELASTTAGLVRISRELCWVRRGWVEEVYHRVG